MAMPALASDRDAVLARLERQLDLLLEARPIPACLETVSTRLAAEHVTGCPSGDCRRWLGAQFGWVEAAFVSDIVQLIRQPGVLLRQWSRPPVFDAAEADSSRGDAVIGVRADATVDEIAEELVAFGLRRRLPSTGRRGIADRPHRDLLWHVWRHEGAKNREILERWAELLARDEVDVESAEYPAWAEWTMLQDRGRGEDRADGAAESTVTKALRRRDRRLLPEARAN